jgi:hypothetical protein
MPSHRHTLALTLAAIALMPIPSFAQESTPAATPAAVVCSVLPRPEADLIAASASPVAPAVVPSDVTGAATDQATLDAIQAVLSEAEQCAQEGDLLRLAALYSDDALASGAFSTEKVPIEAGTPDTTPANADEVIASGAPVVISGINLPDGRVLATVHRGDLVSKVVMVADGERWLIDSDEVVVGTVEGGIGTPIPMDIPLAVLQAVVDEVAKQHPDQVDSVTIISADVVEWPDAALGCLREGERPDLQIRRFVTCPQVDSERPSAQQCPH